MKRNLNYGIIGNCRSAALVSENGDIDWCCMPDLDSPAIFARLLDIKKGGYFGIHTKPESSTNQKFDGNSNILITNFSNKNFSFDLIDFMPRYKTEDGSYYHSPEIFRIIKIIRGNPVLQIDYNPMMNYAASKTSSVLHPDYIKSFSQTGRYESIYLYSGFSGAQIIEKQWIELSEDNFLILCYNQKLVPTNIHLAYLEYNRTLGYWLNWSERTHQFKKYQKEIIRSALVLKLLTYQKTGAIVAAPTTSIPETIGEERNWDYRYCWIRDSSMIIKTLLTIGHFNSSKRFLHFLLNVNEGKHEDIQIMYGIRGEKKLTEKILKHLAGYQNSGPVRIGNSAHIQKQNDIYGILIDAIYLSLTKFPSTLEITEELWTFVRGMIEMVSLNWEKPDRGIWEIRGESRHFVFSKVLSWVAVDRGCKIAKMVGKQTYADDWYLLQETIKNDILQKGWNQQMNSFTQSYGSSYLDASNLLMEDYGFIEASDSMYICTVLSTRDELCKNGMMFRYLNKDDFGKPHSSLIICTFWLINSLYKIGFTKEAEDMFENMLLCTNHLGLLSEHIDIQTKQLLGNFPQGYSHLGLIQSALILNGIKPEIAPEQFNYIKP